MMYKVGKSMIWGQQGSKQLYKAKYGTTTTTTQSFLSKFKALSYNENLTKSHGIILCLVQLHYLVLPKLFTSISISHSMHHSSPPFQVY